MSKEEGQRYFSDFSEFPAGLCEPPSLDATDDQKSLTPLRLSAPFDDHPVQRLVHKLATVPLEVRLASPEEESFHPTVFGSDCRHEVVGMPLGMEPTEPVEEDESVIFILEPDGESDGNEEFTWVAFSTKEKAEAWIASRKSK